MRILWTTWRQRCAQLAVSVFLLALTGGCSVSSSLSAPTCENGQSTLIVAQSVPSAELVPCLTELPRGWTVQTVEITQQGTTIRMDSDRAGTVAAVLWFKESCDTSDAVSLPSDLDGAELFEYIVRITPSFRAQRYYVFPGGCVWWDFDFNADNSAALSIDLGNSLVLVSRDALNENIRDSFIDEEL
ncbi:MAG: hypothetical protein HKN03_09480 [Acidimicrobiales bacterium]|nr:hypothetical protein [Acidimicrobiales bacterium]